jgi:RNA 2',3'-cyclic 3'-phosphodiesterase
MKRLFIAIKLTPDKNLLKTYSFLQNALHYEKIRWVPPDNLHVTLKFLGNTPEEKIPTISEVITNSVASIKPLMVEFANCGIFGSRYKPRVIWFGIKENEELKKIGLGIIDNLNDAGFAKDRQNFVPHLTIGRITKIIDKHMFNDVIGKVKNVHHQETIIDKVILYESVITSNSPTYNVIKSFPLKY